MRKLYLLRHAQAENSLEGADKDRCLSAHGLTQAANVAAHLGEIDMALCSGATRTQMTLKAMTDAGAIVKNTEILDALYNAPAGEILSAIQKQSSTNILVVAHNPGIHQLANILVGGGDAKMVEALRLSYRPATLSIFECDVDKWGALQPQSCTLTQLIEID